MATKINNISNTRIEIEYSAKNRQSVQKEKCEVFLEENNIPAKTKVVIEYINGNGVATKVVWRENDAIELGFNNITELYNDIRTKINVSQNSGGGITEAPSDDNLYGRKNGDWEIIPDVNGSEINPFYISGGAVWSGTGYVYDVSEINYFFNGYKTSEPTQITFDEADELDRIDIIVIDEEGNISVIKGTPNEDLIHPVIPEDKLQIQFVIIKANSTQPELDYDVIYNENLEWTGEQGVVGSIPEPLGVVNFNSTNSPKVGSKCINYNGNQRTAILLQNNEVVDLSNKQAISFWCRLNTPNFNNSGNLGVNLLNGAVNAGVSYVNAFSNGINRNLIGEWQLCIIQLEKFQIKKPVTGVRIYVTQNTTDINRIRDFDIDFVRLIDGDIPVDNTNNFTIQKNGQPIGSQSTINFIEGENIELNVQKDILNDRIDINIKSNSTGEEIYPNIIEEPAFAGFKFKGENVYSIYVEGANFETSNLSDYNIGIGVEVHRANVLDACGNSQGVVFYYTLGDNLCEEGYSSGGEVCVPNFHSEDDMIDYIYYNNDSCIETIEWTGTQIGSKFINDFGINANVLIFNCQKLTSVKLEYVTEMSDSYVYFSNPLLIEILTPLLASVGGDNYIINNSSLTTINQPLLASVGGDNSISNNNSLTTIDLPLLASVGGDNYINDNNSLTTIDLPLLASVGGDNYIYSNNSLTTIDLPLLASVGGYNSISNNNSLTTIDLPLLASVGKDNYIYSNTSLTTIIVAPTLTFNNLNNKNEIYAYYNNNALSQITVDAICDAILAGSTVIPINGAYLDFSGGTNAIPGGTRITDLQNAGWTVMTN